MFNKALSVFLFIILFSFATQAQYQISGTVADEKGLPLEGVDVFIHETHQGATSNSQGYFAILGVKAGHYHLHVTFAGYHSEQLDVDVDHSITNLSFVLEESVNELHQVVIEHSIEKSDIKNNPLQVVHLDNHFLKQQGGSSFMQNLEKIPGVGSLNNGAGVSKPSIRGLNGNRVVVTINGIKQEGQQWGSDHGLEIDVNNADKIEIIKGASSLVYGTDAVAGVINVRPILPKKNNQFNAGQHVSFNSLNNAFRSSTFLSANSKGKWFKIRASILDAGDYTVPSDNFVYQSTILPIYNNRLKNTAVREQVVNAYAGISKNWGYWYVNGSYFNQQSGFFTGAFGVPNAGLLIHDNDFRDIDLPLQQVQHISISGHGNMLINKNWLEFDIGYQNNQRGEIAQPHSAAFLNEKENGNPNQALDLNLSTYTFNTRYFIKDSTSKRIIGLSAQYKSNQIAGYEFIIPAYKTGLIGLFGLYNRTFKNGWKLSTGARFEVNYLAFDSSKTPYYRNGQYVGDAFRSPSFDEFRPIVSASFGLNKELKKDLIVKFNVAKTSRMIQANELGSNGLHHGAFRFERGNIDLNSERAIQNDASIFYEKKRWIVDVSVFYNHFFNFVYLSPSARFAQLNVEGTIYPYPEAGQLFEHTQSRARHLGYEAQLEYSFTSVISGYISSEYTDLVNTDKNEYVPFVAPLSVKSGVEAVVKPKNDAVDEIHAELNIGLYGAQKKVPRNDIPTTSYELVNGNISMYFHNGMEVNVTANNLLNAFYFSNLSRYKIIGLPEPGRSFKVKLSYTFNKNHST